MRRYRVAADAQDDLDDVWDFIAQDNPAAADCLIEFLYERFSLLGSQPLMGGPQPDLALNARHWPVGNYVIVYRPFDGGIDVPRVVHGSREVPAVFRKRPS